MASPKCINRQNIENSIDLIIIRAIHKGTLTKCITRHSKYHITDHKMWCVVFIGYTVMVTASWHHKCTAAQIQPTFYLRFSLFVCRKTMKDGNVSRVHSCREKLQETTSEVCACVCVCRYARKLLQHISFSGKKEKRLRTLEDTSPAKHQHIKGNEKRNRWSSSVYRT